MFQLPRLGRLLGWRWLPTASPDPPPLPTDPLPPLTPSQVHQAKGVGVLVCDHARGLIEDNDISGNARAGVAILSGGNPVVRVNRIHDGKDSGVLVSEKGRGRIEENEIFANLRAGVAILREGAPLRLAQ